MNKFGTFAVLFILILPAMLKENSKSLESELDKTRQNADLELLLADILLNSLQPYKCVAIICDDVYYDVFQQKLFKEFGVYISFIIILVQETEDLLVPFENTQEALLMAKTQGCQFYIILIANGIQVTRLLRYGDRYRVLNTRSNYLMLWDRRLFERDLHYIWKRIINIIFIREYSGIKKTGSLQKVIPWFEISTVPFPSPIKGIFVSRRLDTWRQSKFRTGVDLFRDKTSDLKNQTLKVVTFSHIPATSKIEIPEYKTSRTVINSGSMGFVGIEVEVLNTISVAMNFMPVVYETVNADIELWGEKQLDGQYSGILGEMVKSLADIAIGDIQYTPYFLKLMDLSVPYNTECLTFLTPESLTNNSWKTLIAPFTPIMWAIILTLLMGTGFIFYALSRFHNELNKIILKNNTSPREEVKQNIKIVTATIGKTLNTNEKYVLMRSQYTPLKIEGEPEGLYLFGTLSNSILYTFGMILFISLPKLPSGWSIRMLTGWYWIYCILLVVAYKASMTAILANPAPRVTIDTLQELVHSELPCGGWGEINREFFKTSLDPISQVIGSKFETINDSDSAIDRVARGSFALYENAHFLKEALVRKQMKYQISQSNKSSNEAEEIAKGGHNLHIMSDCVIHMPISIGLQKNSPIKPRVDKFIRRVFEAGLIMKWLDDVMLPTINAEIHLESNDVSKALMNMEKLFGAVVALLVGYFISIIVLISEILYFEFITKKHPNFDKYSGQIRLEPMAAGEVNLVRQIEVKCVNERVGKYEASSNKNEGLRAFFENLSVKYPFLRKRASPNSCSLAVAGSNTKINNSTV